MLFGSFANSKAFPLMAFLIPLVLRIIPEILMGPFVVGFDTLSYYVPNTLLWLRNGVGFWDFMAVAPFFYVLLMGVTSIGVPIVLSLKVTAPLLLGFLGLAVYFYANKTLSWSPRKSLLVVLFATLYFVALRVSWDMLRSEFALIFLFATLIFLEKSDRPLRNGVLLSLAMLSVVFAHQLVAVIMFFIVLVTVARLNLDGKKVDVKRIVVSSIPSGFLFLLIVYADYSTISNFSILSGFPLQDSAGFMSLFGFASYQDLMINTLGFLVFCYLPLLPLILYRRHFENSLQIKAWVLWIFIAVMLALISPNNFFGALPYRWILFLTYPLAFYAAEAFGGIKLNLHKLCYGLMLATLAFGFVFLPNSHPLPYYALFPLYVPTSMLQNTLPSGDCQDTINALQWIRNNVNSDARLLAHDAFYGWASLMLDSSQIIRCGYNNPETAVQEFAFNESRSQFYLIWWINGSGWHGQNTVPYDFSEVYESGRIAIYKFNYTSVSA